MEIQADLHVHSYFSVDGQSTLREMCLAAVEKGLRCICFTEHLDFNPQDQGYGFFDKSGFFQGIDALRQEFDGRLEILKGIEFGEPHAYPGEFEKASRENYDFILGSIHFVDGCFVGEPELEQKYTKERIFAKYYEEVLAAVTFGGFDALAHFDFPKRYLGESFPEMPVIGDIVAMMAKHKIALEINTSSIRKGLGECTPGLTVVQKFIDNGFDRVTIGSDAHRARDLAVGFPEAAELLGQTKCTPGIFRQREFVRCD